MGTVFSCGIACAVYSWQLLSVSGLACHYRTELAAREIERMTPNVIFRNGVCIHGSSIFEIVLNILEIDAKEQEDFEIYFTPFSLICNERI